MKNLPRRHGGRYWPTVWCAAGLWLAAVPNFAQRMPGQDLATNTSARAAAPSVGLPATSNEATAAELTVASTPQGALLTWSAPAGRNVRFEVERSTDGVHFRSVGAATSPATTGSYRFLDAPPTGDPVYYRLRQPADGSITDIVTYHPEGPAWQLSPNPAADWISCGSATGEYRILDAAGRTVQTGHLAPGQRVDVRRLRNGHYALELHAGNTRVSRPFLKYTP